MSKRRAKKSTKLNFDKIEDQEVEMIEAICLSDTNKRGPVLTFKDVWKIAKDPDFRFKSGDKIDDRKRKQVLLDNYRINQLLILKERLYN